MARFLVEAVDGLHLSAMSKRYRGSGSAFYAVAVATLDGPAMDTQFSPRRIEQDDNWELFPKIEAHPDAAFDKRGGNGPGAAGLRIRFSNGAVEGGFKPVARGIITPLSAGEVFEVPDPDQRNPPARSRRPDW
jgi:hypothetical protein